MIPSINLLMLAAQAGDRSVFWKNNLGLHNTWKSIEEHMLEVAKLAAEAERLERLEAKKNRRLFEFGAHDVPNEL